MNQQQMRYNRPIHDFESARIYLNGRTSRNLPGRETRLIQLNDDRIAVRYHNTNIVTYKREGSMIVGTGGYWTSSTKSKINIYAGYSIYQKNWQFYNARTGEKWKDGTIIESKA